MISGVAATTAPAAFTTCITTFSAPSVLPSLKTGIVITPALLFIVNVTELALKSPPSPNVIVLPLEATTFAVNCVPSAIPLVATLTTILVAAPEVDSLTDVAAGVSPIV